MVAALLLAGCGYFSGSSAARVKTRSPIAAPRTAQDSTVQALAGMVEAVGPGNSSVPVELKFTIRERPEVGRVDEIDFAVVPQTGGLDAVRVVFGALSGLEVVSGAFPPAMTKPASGVPIFGSVEVRPLQVGLFTLTAAVGVQSPSQSSVWPFSIPVIAVGEAGTASSEAGMPSVRGCPASNPCAAATRR